VVRSVGNFPDMLATATVAGVFGIHSPRLWRLDTVALPPLSTYLHVEALDVLPKAAR